MALFPSTSIPSAAGGYDIDNSCRFETSWLRRVNTSGSAKTKWTVSFWFKRSSLCTGSGWSNPFTQYLWNSDTSYAAGNQDAAVFLNGDRLAIYCASPNFSIWPVRLFRDTSAWYHLVVEVDSTQATNTNRVKVWINGVQEEVANMNGWADNSALVWPTQNDTYDITNSTLIAQTIGGRETAANTMVMEFDGYISEFHFVDDTALTANTFGEFDEDYGHWKPKKVSGVTYGTTGYHLDFKDSGSLGNDANGSNNFTPTSITASDQSTDSPTNNFAVMNNLNNQPFATTFAEGNLEMTTGGSSQEPSNMATIGMSTGKWYFEVYQKSGSSAGLLGIRSQQPGTISPTAKDNPGKAADGYAFLGDSSYGNLVAGNSYVSYGTLIGYTTGDIISVAVDIDNDKIYWAKNGTYVNSGDPTNPGGGTGHPITAVNSTSTGEYFPCFGDYSSGSYVFVVNFGQDGTFAGNKSPGTVYDDGDYGSFHYQPPAGFKALCSKNLPEPAVKPGEHFGVMLYDDGAGAKTFASHGIPTGARFQPDLVWLKSRGNAYESELIDALRGVTKALVPNESFLEVTDSTGLTAFGADGFTVGSDANYSDTTGDGMVAWCWKANGSGSANEAGSINTTATSVNTAAGFSISTYTGNGSAGATIGHGLSVTPNLVIVKRRSSGDGWMIGSIQPFPSMDFDDALVLDTTAAILDDISKWNDTAPTAELVSLGTNYEVNASGHTYVAYCFHNVEGYSKIGSYKGNANVDGTFVYCGFKPAYILIKVINASGEHWLVHDSTRSTYNVSNKMFRIDLAETEQTASWTYIDILSNGFKTRVTSGNMNASASYYLFYAIAETPFKYATAK